jgi:hypothetical protein
MTQERGNRLIKAGLGDSVAFGRPYIANPDLPERFLIDASLNEVSWPTVYASGPQGYTDYPAQCADFKRRPIDVAPIVTEDGGIAMSKSIQEKNKALVRDAFDTLFNKRD